MSTTVSRGFHALELAATSPLPNADSIPPSLSDIVYLNKLYQYRHLCASLSIFFCYVYAAGSNQHVKWLVLATKIIYKPLRHMVEAMNDIFAPQSEILEEREQVPHKSHLNLFCGPPHLNRGVKCVFLGIYLCNKHKPRFIRYSVYQHAGCCLHTVVVHMV